jgi:hypothetical protein
VDSRFDNFFRFGKCVFFGKRKFKIFYHV